MSYTYRVFEDNAGHYHLFAVAGGVPVAGFETPDINDITYAIKHTVDPATEWEGQYGCDDDIDADFDHYMEAMTLHICESVKKAYAALSEWVDARNGGAQELTLSDLSIEEDNV